MFISAFMNCVVGAKFNLSTCTRGTAEVLVNSGFHDTAISSL